MNNQEYLEFHKNFCQQMIKITAQKNHDYAVDSDAFSNFKNAEKLGICSNEAGFLIRIMDKISRITNYLNKGELLVEDESVTDSIQDAANYLILLAGYLYSKSDDIEF